MLKKISISFILVFIAAFPLFAKENVLETRCGWFHNPSPANITLYDRDGEWIFSVQGGYQLKEDWEWPKFKPSEWVNTNVNYGYGCICMNAVVNHKDRKVITIQTLKAKPLKSCQKDPALKKWKSFLQ
ncbi:PF13316 family protein [Leptospira noguchii str. 2006001870]|uniref:DUF4087 domain-containing protein n=1 Tax=Leptospira noguchii TaxID=28182 RepID=UPI000248968E|nr:DUF4087 domain-containing protein [Leptospira noguchii]EKR75302.1 PF13316 family protein [Leptospira noguchii str. 2006001870]